MSGTTLLCPTCEAPVPPRVESNVRPAIERYTCEACGRTTLRDELIRRVDLRMSGAGAPASSPPAVPVFGLLETLRGLTVLGDMLDATYEELTGLTTGLSVCPASPAALSALSVVPVSISYLRFFARVSWFTTGVGPDDAHAWVIWRVNGGTTSNGDDMLPPGGVGVFTQIDGLVAAVQDIALDPDGAPWTVASINDLHMAGGFLVNDNGGPETTTVRVSEVWAEVWGYI